MNIDLKISLVYKQIMRKFPKSAFCMNRKENMVSIIMATYNRGHLISESIEAIIQQSYKEWECLIIDDGSTDDTKNILDTYLDQDSRFKYFTRNDIYKKGLPGCRNMGLEVAQGDYVVFFDDDDIPHPDCLKWSIEEIIRNNVDYCRYLRTVFFQELNKDFDCEKDYNVRQHKRLAVEELITGKVPFNSCQVIWKAGCFENEKFNEELMFAEEWELYTRILLKRPKGITIEKYLYFGRKHAASNTGEFKQANSMRVNSKIHAAKLIIEHTDKAGELSKSLTKFFIRMGFDLKSYSLINEALNKSNMDLFEKSKYKLGFIFYPILQPLLKLKGTFKFA